MEGEKQVKNENAAGAEMNNTDAPQVSLIFCNKKNTKK